MPIHDWTKVDAGLFHDFHLSWTATLRNALNSGVLPPDYFALAEQRIQEPIPDVLTLKLSSNSPASNPLAGGPVLTLPPRTSLIRRNEADIYAAKADRITVRHRHGDVVAVLEIVSPGNKGSRAELRAFLEKTVGLIRQGIHLLVIDLIPPGKRDPDGLPQSIWDQISEDDLSLPPDKPLSLTSFDSGPEQVVYVETVAVGDLLPDMPLFLKTGVHVKAPLESTYQLAWSQVPGPLKPLLAVEKV